MCKLSNINIDHKYMNIFIKSLFYLHLNVEVLTCSDRDFGFYHLKT